MKLEAGLQSLRLCTDTDKSLFHSWSSSFAAGHFDGHQSVLPAPDHRVFHGMAHKLVSAMFFLMEEAKRVVAEMSWRDSLRAGLLRRTRVYHLKKGKMYVGLTISGWSAVLTAAPFAFGRELRRPSMAALGFGMDLLWVLHRLTATLYFFSRVALDGAAAGRERRTAHTLGEEVADFAALVQRVCLRLDCALFQRALAVPSLHRPMEMCALVSPAGPVGHVRHVTELGLDGAHQPNERAFAGGNGHDDAGQAMRAMVESEFFSRLVLAPSSFFVPPE